MNSLSKLIFLSVLISIGFLNIVLSCALFDNWLPLFVIGIFLIAPIPNIISNNVSSNYESDFLSDSNSSNSNPIKEFCEFLTGFLIISGLLLPITFYHSNLIEFYSLILSTSGGLIVYSTILTFNLYFKYSNDDYDDYDF